MANEELYTPVNPSPELYTPVDMNFGGVEQQMPSAADIAAASPQPITGKKNLIMNNGDSTSPRMVLTNYQASDQKDLPEYISEPNGKPKPPELYTPAALPQTSDQPEMYTPAAPPSTPLDTFQQQQPWFPGDPTAKAANLFQNAANWVGDQFKTAGQGLYDTPTATAGSIADKTGTGLISFLTQFGSEILPIISPTSVIQDVIQSPDSFLADLRTKAGQQGDSVAEYVRKTLYDYTAMQSGISKAEADKSYVTAKDMPANAGGEAGAQIGAMVATKGIAPIASYLEQQTKEAFGPNAGALVGMLGDTLMMGQGAQGKGPAVDLRNVDRIARIKDLNDQYAQERTKTLGNIVDQIIPPTDGSYTSSRGLSPSDEQKAMLAEHPEPGPQVPGMDVTDSSTVPHNLKEHLDVVASNPDAAPWQRTLAESYRNLSDTLGLDQIPVYGKAGKDPSRYDRATDSITIASDHPDLNHQVLHEANHAIA